MDIVTNGHASKIDATCRAPVIELLKVDDRAVYGRITTDQILKLNYQFDNRLEHVTSGYPSSLFQYGEGSRFFVIPLPVGDRERSARLDVWLEASGERPVSLDLIIPAEQVRNGIRGSEMVSLLGGPLCKISTLNFFDGKLFAGGFAQSPFDHDRSKVRIETSCGVSAADVFRLSLGHEDTFWFLPDAKFNGVEVQVPLSEMRFDAKEMEVRFLYESASVARNDIGRSFSLPLWLSSFCCFPDSKRLNRVHSFDSVTTAAVHGFSDARRFRQVAELHGNSCAGATILDWGCGYGRVLRHFVSDGDVGRCIGVDIDADNIRWASANLTGAEFSVVPLMPPTSIAEASIDIVYGLSVMTHLPPDVQNEWLDEITRVLKPGGIALITIAGDAAVAYSSRYLSRDQLDAYLQHGTITLPYGNFDAEIADGDYYKNVNVSRRFVEDHWERGPLKLEAFYARAFAIQDLCVLRKGRSMK